MKKNMKRLYQQVIMDHNKKPRNFNNIENTTHFAQGINPLCGDEYQLFLEIKNNIIENIGFTGTGCAISKSVSSMMTEEVKEKTIEHALKMKDKFIELLTENISADEAKHLLGHLTLFESVKEFPIRVKCATLIWRALEAAITKNNDKVTTE